MTREEAVNELNDRIKSAEYVDSDYIDCVSVDAVKMAISALSVPETNVGDTISRQAAIDLTQSFSVCGYIEEETEKIVNALKALPSAEPERKMGRWQITDSYPHNVYCSECHVKFAQTNWAVWEDGSLPRNFCPNCGADMRGE